MKIVGGVHSPSKTVVSSSAKSIGELRRSWPSDLHCTILFENSQECMEGNARGRVGVQGSGFSF